MSSQRSDTQNQRSQETVSQRREDDRDSALYDPFASSKIYYGTSHGPRKIARSRAYTFVDSTPSYPLATFTPGHRRRTSLDEPEINPIQFWLYVDKTTKNLLDREDTDGNVQITIEDAGLKTIELGTAASGGYRRHEVRGTYKLSNLLQELTLAKTNNRTSILLDGARLTENPVDRLSRYIKDEFWDNLTRRIDGSNVGVVARDPKDWTANPRARIYIPRGAPEQHEYYTRIAAEHPDIQLDVQWLKEPCDDPQYVRDLNEAPGLLAVAMERIDDTPDGKADYRGLPFVVPGGRFNELYGWDSYMESIGLLLNDRVDLGEAMVKHFCFCIRHYGKILNANRTYYLCRSQPPFLTDMAVRVHERIQHRPDSLEFLRQAMLAAIKEYYTVWTAEPRFDPVTSLSRYMPGGLGVPPETEATHFIHILAPYAEKHNMDFADFVHAYNYGLVSEPDLDEYFLHDRAVRESGHDTTYRFESVCAHLATVDLNSLLYKYESDISRIIRQFFGDKLVVPPEWQVAGRPSVERSSSWDRRARQRRERMNRYMWDESKGMFFDYHTVNKKHTGYETATTFWAMWAGVCNPRQATIMVDKALPRFEVLGGLVSGTEESRGPIGLHRPSRQWDYPFGWAPQQILAWMGLIRYGYEEEAQRLAYRWAFMMTKAFVDFNGVVVEKYDVTRQVDPHKVEAEYGNQGADFKGVALEGFGWVNASYVLAMSILTTHMKRALGALAPWDTFESKTRHKYSRQAHVGQPPSHSEDVQSV